MRVFILAFMLVGLAAMPAAGKDLAPIRAAIVAGDYDQAENLGRAAGTRGALLLAGESLTTRIMIGGVKNEKSAAQAAIDIADAILKTVENDKDALLLRAIASGFYHRQASPIKAWRKRIPQKLYAVINTAQIANPGNPNADALMAAWHLSIAAKAGRKRAMKMFGADFETGEALFRKAIASDPDNISIYTNYAMMMAASDMTRFADELWPDLKARKFIPGSDADRQLVAILDQFRSNYAKNPKAARKIAKSYLKW